MLPAERIVALGAPDLVDGPHPIRQPAEQRHHTLIHSEIDLLNWRAFARRHGDIVLDLERGRLVVLFGDTTPLMPCHSLSILKPKLDVLKIEALREWLFEELQQPLPG